MSDETLSPLSFAGVEIPCMVLDGFSPPPQPMAFSRTAFAGVDGESSIRMGLRGRTIDVPILLRGGFDDRAAIEQFIDEELFGITGENSQLVYTPPNNGSERTFDDCEFEGFFQSGSPKPDPSGTLAGTGEGEGWHVLGILRFTQLGGLSE